MELGAIQRIFKAKTPKKNKNNRKNKTCYVYNKPGHFIKDYRLKNIILRRQLNAIIKKDIFEKQSYLKNFNLKSEF